MPLNSAAIQRPVMPPALGVVLVVFGLLLCGGMVLLAGAISASVAGCASGTGGPSTPTPTPTPNPTPGITSLSPGSATVGGQAFTLTVHGSNFLPASTMEWNGNSRTTTFISSSQLQAHIMAADLATTPSCGWRGLGAVAT